MARFGGIPLEDERATGKPRFGGIPVESEQVQKPAQQAQQPEPQYNPTDDMTSTDRALAGAGKMFVDQFVGIKQLGLDVASELSERTDYLAMSPPVSALAWFSRKFQPEVKQAQADIQAEVDEMQQVDAPLMDTTAGKVGYVGGALATGVLVPGGASLPARMAIGAGLGASQPVASDGSRLTNAAIGGAAAGVLPPAVAGAARGAGKVAQAVAPKTSDAIARGAKSVAGKYTEVMETANNAVVRAVFKPQSTTSINVQRAAADLENVTSQAATKAGINWEGLDDGLKARMLASVQDAAELGSDLPPEALIRKAILESQGLTPTRALITRDWNDQFIEQNLLTEPEGAALRNIYEGNNSAIRDNIRKLGGGVDAVDAPEFGQQFRQPIQAAERAAQKQANEAFDVAVDAEGGNIASPQALIDYMQENMAILNATNAGKPVVEFMKKMGIVDAKNTSKIITPWATQAEGQGLKGASMNLREVSALRKVVNSAWTSAKKSGDDQAAFQLNQMRQIINGIEENAGGDLFKAYRQIRSQKGKDFEDNRLIDQLLSKKIGYNSDLISDSEVYQKIIIGSNFEEFGQVWSKATPEAKALTRAQVAYDIEDYVFSNQAMTSKGDPVASAAKLQQRIKKLGMRKLVTIFGKEDAENLMLLMKTLKEISNPPKGTVPQGSAPKIAFLTRNVLSVLRGMGRLPSVAGDAATGVAKTVESGMAGNANAAAAEAAIDPLKPFRDAAIKRMKDAQAAEKARKAAFLTAPAAIGATGASQ